MAEAGQRARRRGYSVLVRAWHDAVCALLQLGSWRRNSESLTGPTGSVPSWEWVCTPAHVPGDSFTRARAETVSDPCRSLADRSCTYSHGGQHSSPATSLLSPASCHHHHHHYDFHLKATPPCHSPTDRLPRSASQPKRPVHRQTSRAQPLHGLVELGSCFASRTARIAALEPRFASLFTVLPLGCLGP